MNLIKNIKKAFHFQTTIAQTINSCNQRASDLLILRSKINELTNLTLNSQEMGVSGNLIAKEEVIVSLTTHSGRLYDAYIAIESIMQGTMKPNRIILWISDNINEDEIPLTLRKQMKRGLEIKFRKDIRSYTKFIYALEEYPESAIITVDDDIIYPIDTIENLVRIHNEFPGMICANAIRPIPEDYERNFISYLDFDTIRGYKTVCTQRYLLEGYCGVLYPPHCLLEEVHNREIFLKICKTADDVWFSAMAMANHTQIVCANPHLYFFRFMNNEDLQDLALRNINTRNEILNDRLIKDVFTKYGILKS